MQHEKRVGRVARATQGGGMFATASCEATQGGGMFATASCEATQGGGMF